MKVVLDTNVLIASFATNGLCKDLFEFCLKEAEIILSEAILQELEKNLSKKLGISHSRIETIKDFLLGQTYLIQPIQLPSNSCRDSDDTVILATAIAGKIDYIVTGDEDLLVLKEFRGIPVLSPRDFWKFLSRQGHWPRENE